MKKSNFKCVNIMFSLAKKMYNRDLKDIDLPDTLGWWIHRYSDILLDVVSNLDYCTDEELAEDRKCKRNEMTYYVNNFITQEEIDFVKSLPFYLEHTENSKTKIDEIRARKQADIDKKKEQIIILEQKLLETAKKLVSGDYLKLSNEDFLKLCNKFQIPLHPRTIGYCKTKLSYIENDGRQWCHARANIRYSSSEVAKNFKILCEVIKEKLNKA